MASSDKSPNRFLTVLTGVVLGFAWGSVMWLLTTAFGQKTGGVRGWLEISLGIAMIGGGVAAFFGAIGAKRSGERIGPRFRRR